MKCTGVSLVSQKDCLDKVQGCDATAIGVCGQAAEETQISCQSQLPRSTEDAFDACLK